MLMCCVPSEARSVEDVLADFESNTMDGLKIGYVKLRSVIVEQHAGSQGRIMNQMITGTVSPTHVFECTQKKIGALMDVSRMQG
jgi:hypothetical protein